MPAPAPASAAPGASEASFATVASAVVIGSLAPLMLGVAPVVVGALVERLGFTPAQAGLVISAHLGGIGVAGVPMTFLVRKPIWRKLLLAALPVLVGLFALAAFVKDPGLLALTLFGAGLAGGVAVSITLPIMSRSKSPTTAFAWWVVLQLAVGSAGVALMPTLLASVGIGGLFLALAAIMALMGPLLVFVPAGPDPSEAVAGSAPAAAISAVGIVGLAGLFLFYVAVGASWAYFERIGDAAGIAAGPIARTLSIATLCGVLGALLAAFTPPKLGQLGPLELGVLTLVVALGVLFTTLTETSFLTSAVLFKIAWTFTLPFLLGSLSLVDKTGRLLVLANIIIGVGLASGPAIAAAFVRPGQFSGVVSLGLFGVLGCGLAFLLLSMRLRGQAAPLAPAAR